MENLGLAFRKARKRKTQKQYVLYFEKNLYQNLLQLQYELLFHTYRPEPIITFILRDPKTRKIGKSAFRDRVVHHALCNVIEPIFDKAFIHDSFANRSGRGTHSAIDRFDHFKRKVSKNNIRSCYVLKADIRQYFDTVDHSILLSILRKKIKDKQAIWLIKTILANHKTRQNGMGMPLGNLTSQFFANVYLNELDYFVKHKLKAKYYIRYVDDFVILHHSRSALEEYRGKINDFLKGNLMIRLHPQKSKIFNLDSGINFLGFRVFFYHKLVRKSNLRKFGRRFEKLKVLFGGGRISREEALESIEGWLAYIKHADTYKYQKNLVTLSNECFPYESTKTPNMKKHENFMEKVNSSKFPFSSQKTLYLLKKGFSAKQIAEKRGITKGTVWEHLAQLIEHNQLPVWAIVPKDKSKKILPNIRSSTDKLKDIKAKLNDNSITFAEINCVLASVKCRSKKFTS